MQHYSHISEFHTYKIHSHVKKILHGICMWDVCYEILIYIEWAREISWVIEIGPS